MTDLEVYESDFTAEETSEMTKKHFEEMDKIDYEVECKRLTDVIEKMKCEHTHEKEKLKEEIRILQSEKRDLEQLVIKLNMRMFMNY